MPRWTALSSDHLKAAGHGEIIEQAGTLATGALDPVDEALADAAARVRRAVSTGNVLDADAAKVPNSLKGVAVRLALYGLCERIGLPLTDDQKEQRRNDNSDLKRITDNRMRVEAPDVADASGEMQAIGGAVEAVNVPRRLTGRGRTAGL